MNPPSTLRPAPGRNRAEPLPELELIKIVGFVMVLACHFWVQHALPALMGVTTRVPGMGIDASTPARIDLSAWFPTFTDHPVIYGAFNLLFGFGYQGVGVFFVLTGFGLTLSALKKPRFGPWAYLVGRFERVYLPYLFLLGAYTAFNWWQGGRSLLDLRALTLMDTGIPYAWFMLPLLQFYLLFPLLFLLVRSGRVTVNQLMAGALVANFLWAFVVLFAAYNFLPWLAIPGACPPKGFLLFRLAEPVLGMWLAHLYHHRRDQFEALFHPRRWPLFAGLYAIGCAFSLAETNFTWGRWLVPLGQSATNFLVAAGLFGVLLIGSRRVVAALGSFLPLSRYGFEFYLIQAIPLTGAAWLLPHLELTPLLLLGVLALLIVVNFTLAIAMQHFSQAVLAVTYYRLRQWLQRVNAAAPTTPAAPSAAAQSSPAARGTTWPLLTRSPSKAPFA